jgi:hypothetical protein
METAFFSEMLVITYEIARSHNTQDPNVNLHRIENMKFHKGYCVLQSGRNSQAEVSEERAGYIFRIEE